MSGVSGAMFKEIQRTIKTEAQAQDGLLKSTTEMIDRRMASFAALCQPGVRGFVARLKWLVGR